VIDNYADCGGEAAAGIDDIDCFLHAATARDDVFNDDEFFVRCNSKAAAQANVSLIENFTCQALVTDTKALGNLLRAKVVGASRKARSAKLLQGE